MLLMASQVTSLSGYHWVGRWTDDEYLRTSEVCQAVRAHLMANCAIGRKTEIKLVMPNGCSTPDMLFQKAEGQEPQQAYEAVVRHSCLRQGRARWQVRLPHAVYPASQQRGDGVQWQRRCWRIGCVVEVLMAGLMARLQGHRLADLKWRWCAKRKGAAAMWESFHA